jgi:hypothetical protein
MKNRLTWIEQDLFEGVTHAWKAEGDMFILEVQVQDDDTVVGTVWRPIPATFWEPEDIACILEATYECAAEAKLLLEKYDAEELKAEQESDARFEAAILEMRS